MNLLGIGIGRKVLTPKAEDSGPAPGLHPLAHLNGQRLLPNGSGHLTVEVNYRYLLI